MKCGYNKCGKFFKPMRPNQHFCCPDCQKAEYNQRRNERQREQTKAVKPVIEPYKPKKPKYKSPISDKEQKAHDLAIKAKYEIKPGPVKVLTRKEIEEIYPTLTPPERQRNVSALFGLCSGRKDKWC